MGRCTAVCSSPVTPIPWKSGHGLRRRVMARTAGDRVWFLAQEVATPTDALTEVATTTMTPLVPLGWAEWLCIQGYGVVKQVQCNGAVDGAWCRGLPLMGVGEGNRAPGDDGLRRSPTSPSANNGPNLLTLQSASTTSSGNQSPVEPGFSTLTS